MAVRYTHKDADREMLEQPGAHDVGGDLRKDAALLLPLGGAVRLGVFVGGAVTGPDTVVQSVTCVHSRPQYTYSLAHGLLQTGKSIVD